MGINIGLNINKHILEGQKGNKEKKEVSNIFVLHVITNKCTYNVGGGISVKSLLHKSSTKKIPKCSKNQSTI